MKTESHQNLCMFRQLLSLLAALLCAWQALAGTPVLMADGQFTPIEESGCGDLVLTCVDGENVPAEVTDVFHGETREWVDISVAGLVVRATPGHLFRVGEEWVEEPPRRDEPSECLLCGTANHGDIRCMSH